MKLSAKLLTGLAFVALIGIAVVGLSNNSASAAVDGKVYVTNVASKLTTEAGNPSDATNHMAPTARTTATTVYGTYPSFVTTGSSARDIVTSSNIFVVTVLDADVNTTTVATANHDGTGYDMANAWLGSDNVEQGFGSGFETAGEQVRITFEDVGNPIVGAASTIKAYKTGSKTVTELTNLNISIVQAGDGVTSKPIIDVSIASGTVSAVNAITSFRYNTSAKDVITASVKSVVDTTGSVVTLTETGFNSGRFEGYVEVQERTARTTQGTGGNYCPTIVAKRPAWTGDPSKCEGSVKGGTLATAATIPATAGPITITYVDKVTSGTSTNVSRTASYSLDVTAPTLTFTAPVTGSAGQSRLPTFAGSFTDNESGIDESTFALYVDESADATNTTLVVPVGSSWSATPGKDKTTFVSTSAAQNNGVGESLGSNSTVTTVAADLMSVTLPTAVVDGTKTFEFSKTATATLPTSVTNPDHIVDFQARAADLAGNYGYTDSDAANNYAGAVGTSGSTVGRHGNQPHTIRIDQVLPSISTAEAGSGFDETLACCTAKANVRDMIKVTFDGKLNADSVAATDFSVVLDGTGGTFVPATVTVKDAVVYLDIDSTIPSNDTPAVKLVGTVQDLAGNSSSAGTTNATDKLSPVITVATSGGSGTGTADNKEDAANYTKDAMVITVTSDEALQGPPLVTVTDISATGVSGADSGKAAAAVRYNGVLAVAQGGNVWKFTANKLASAAINADTAVFRAVKVVSTDVAANATTTNAPTTASPAVHTRAYTLDLVLSTPTSTPANAGTTTQTNPFLTTDYKAGSENSTVTISEATIAAGTATAVTVTDQVIASADGKTFFYQPKDALADGEHTYVVKGVDAAGNKLTTTTTFTKSARKDFVVELFAGWNSVSVPSNPSDSAVDSVLSNAGIKQVVSYDATTPAQPWRIASKVDGTFTSQTDPGLTTVTAGPGYWVETSDFEDQTISLEGPTAPGDARPGLTTIATGDGWNLVGVVDQSRTQTQKGNKNATLTRPNASGVATNVTVGTYFNTVNNGRAYTFNTVASEFRELVTADTMTIGSGVWVFISPQTNGGLPHIVP